MGPTWIQRQLYGEDAGVGYEAVRALEAVNTAPGGGHPDRTALIAPYSNLALPARDERSAPAGGAARGS